MIYVFSLLAGVVGALAGWAVAVLGATAAGVGTGAASAESMLAFVVIGPIGSVIGFFAAVALALYSRGGFRSFRDIAMRSVAVAAILGVALAGAYSLRTATLMHLGINTAAPAVEFEIRLPTVTASASIGRDAQVELRTDRNQTIARLDDHVLTTGDGRTVLKGSVPLAFRTNDRLMILSLPGQGQQLFKLRLAADPSRSAEFSPWHLADGVVAPGGSRPATSNDSFAIRYRVL
jgi:hypothetical protein